ncbi:MAG: hypothetical protein M1818_001205 [Claussenomyces sp. TS43310]|nr:MAG: hypothetical protein M1818_001205 [Claussenomyces sp. TS43310]
MHPFVSISLALILGRQLAIASAPGFPGISYEDLPSNAVFPGPWESYIQAPKNKSHIHPKNVWKTEGDISAAEAVLDGFGSKPGMTFRPSGMATFEFEQNIAGRVCIEVESLRDHPFVALSYSESPDFADKRTDATGDLERDLNLLFPLTHNGTNCVGPEFVRGAFKYLTIHMPEDDSEKDGFWHTNIFHPAQDAKRDLQDGGAQKFVGGDQKPLKPGEGKRRPAVNITAIWVNCTAFPSNPNPRAYTGYFDSSSTVLNRAWYAGAYTLQLSTLAPKEGSALIDYNRGWDGNQSPQGSWYSNFSISEGRAVTTDGGKRDRMVWPGDMSIAAPGIAVSTYDMLAIQNALNVLLDHQYTDGSLPYAGPPMGRNGEFSDTYHLHTLLGAYNYILFSGDLNWLQMVWEKYCTALYVSVGKVDETGLIHVTSNADWLRPGMTGHNVEASAILYDVIYKSVELARFIGDDRWDAQEGGLWLRTAARIKAAVEKTYCPQDGLYADNLGRRNCGGSEEVLPQDGNSWVLISELLDDSKRKYNMSENLRSRWGKYGAPAVEFPNTISPFATGFELIAHCAADNHDAAVELIELMWGYMLDGPGMTNSTCVEGYRVDGGVQYPAYWSAARNSHAHGWSSGPTMVLLTEVLGIHLDSPMGRTWHLTPHVTKWLQYAQGGFATRLGEFEVKVKRMRDASGRPAEVLDFRAPVGSLGRVDWGGAVMADVAGGRYRVARMLDAPSQLLHFTDPAWQHLSDDEYTAVQAGWATAAVGDLVFDEAWMPPAREEREAGVVDWEALEANYIVRPPKQERTRAREPTARP